MARIYTRSARAPNFDETARRKIWRLHCQGVGTRDIADRLGTSHSSITHILTEQRAAAHAAASQAAVQFASGT